jgi:glycosyltransferase involved in cell wall biosynthesis
MISIVIPAYNEESAIAATIGEIRGALAAGPVSTFEIIVVDDGSQDRTAAIAAAAGATVLRHPHNIGYGRSLKDGIAAAAHDVVAIIDADGTYPADQIPRLAAALDHGFDMVVGARTGAHYRGSGMKPPLRGLLTFLVEFTVGRRVPDVNSGLRVFRRSAIVPYFPQLCETFSFTTSMTLAYMLTGRFVEHMPIDYRVRVGATNVRLFRDSLRTAQYIVQGLVYYNPVKMFLLLAAGAFGVGLLAALVLGIAGLPGATVVAAEGLLAGLVIFALGLVADLLRQILNR